MDETTHQICAGDRVVLDNPGDGVRQNIYRGTVQRVFLIAGVEWADIHWDYPYFPCTTPMETRHLLPRPDVLVSNDELSEYSLTVKAEAYQAFKMPEPESDIRFHLKNEEVGRLTWENGVMQFSGNADESMKEFVDAYPGLLTREYLKQEDVFVIIKQWAKHMFKLKLEEPKDLGKLLDELADKLP